MMNFKKSKGLKWSVLMTKYEVVTKVYNFALYALDVFTNSETRKEEEEAIQRVIKAEKIQVIKDKEVENINVLDTAGNHIELEFKSGKVRSIKLSSETGVSWQALYENGVITRFKDASTKVKFDYYNNVVKIKKNKEMV